MLVIDILQDLGFAWIEAADSATGRCGAHSTARTTSAVYHGLRGECRAEQRLSRAVNGFAYETILNGHNGRADPGDDRGKSATLIDAAVRSYRAAVKDPDA
jgi:hypothetical protein